MKGTFDVLSNILLSSATAFNFGKTKILSSDKELTLIGLKKMKWASYIYSKDANIAF